MSVCFYINSTRMMGLDVHEGFRLPTFTDMYAWWPGTYDKDTDTVSTEGFDFIQDGYELFVPVHIPLSLNPAEAAIAAKAIATGGSKPFLAKMTVHGMGKPLACCAYACLGINANCWDSGPLKKVPSGIVICSTSVVTTPSRGDWAAAAVGLLFDNAKSHVVSAVFKKAGMEKLPATILKQVFRYTNHVARVLDKWLGFPVSKLNPAVRAVKSSGVKGKAKKAVQEAVDDFFGD